MRKKTQFFMAFMAIFLILGVYMSTTLVYAYNYEEYEMLEDKILVDNKHDTASHVNLYILSSELLSGYFNYVFYQTDGQPYYNGAVTTPLIYHTRVENLKEVKTNADGSRLYMVVFGIENGKYVFSDNFCTGDAITLTPDYKDPRKDSPIDATGADAYLASYTEYFVDVADETINLYCIAGNDTWVEEHINTLIDFAKEHDNPTEYENPYVDAIDSSDTDEIRKALTEAPTLSVIEPETEDAFVSGTTGTNEPNLLSIVITIVFFVLFTIGCIWQRKKKKYD